MNRTFYSALKSEERVLLQIARLTLDEQNIAALDRLLHEDLNWQELFQLSVAQSVTPLLYRHLQSRPSWWRRVPETLRHRLHKIYHDNIARNELLLQELDDLLASFNAAEIPVMLMKELHLLQTIYEDIGLRPLGDMDILVPAQNFTQAKQLLARAGYAPAVPKNPFKDKYGFGYHFIHREKNIWIDLQSNLSQREWAAQSQPRRNGEFRAPIEKIWQRAAAGVLLAQPAWRAAWEDLLFHLSVHAEGHGFEELMQFCDIAEVIQQHGAELDWEYLVAVARDSRMEGSLHTTLRLMHEIWRVETPDHVLAQLEPAYLKFDLYEAAFGRLGRLHTFLDEAANDVSMPTAALSQWESVVRQTAEENYDHYNQLDQANLLLKANGVHPAALLTQAAERVLPHERLQPFGQIELLLLDEARLDVSSPTRHAELSEGLLRQLNEVGKFDASLENATAHPAAMQFHVAPNALRRFWEQPEAQAASSLRLIKKAWQTRAKKFPLQIPIHLLTREDLLLALCLRFYHHASSWLGVTTITGFLRNNSDKVNWPKFWESARAYQSAQEAAAALLFVRDLTGGEFPEAALQSATTLAEIPALSLFTAHETKEQQAPQLKKAVMSTVRFLLLPSLFSRWQYLTNLARAAYPELGVWRKLQKLGGEAWALFKMWRAAKTPAPQQAAATPAAYWLEKPRLERSMARPEFAADEKSMSKVTASQICLAS